MTEANGTLRLVLAHDAVVDLGVPSNNPILKDLHSQNEKFEHINFFNLAAHLASTIGGQCPCVTNTRLRIDAQI